MTFVNRVRLPILFRNPQFPMDRNVFRKADGTTKVQSIVIRNTYEGRTDQLPEDWHRKLVIALAHDTVNIENERLLSGVSLDGDYNIDWQDFLQYPVAPANFQVQVTPFNATNSNCQSCETVNQVVCNDDTTDEVWDEGTTHDFPDVLTDNDDICCRPYVISLVTYNTQFFSACSIDPATGILTATVIDPAPVVDNVLIARYRVTCADGQYDEADVYGNITGTDSDFCYAPVQPITKTEISETSVLIDWDFIIPAPVSGWNWELYATNDLGTLLQSGNVAVSEITLTGLTAFQNYTIFITSDCGGGNTAIPSRFDFSITSFPQPTCGKFQVEIIGGTVNTTYMNCAGVIVNETFIGAQANMRCMLIDVGGTVPIYFVSDSPDTAITYISLC